MAEVKHTAGEVIEAIKGTSGIKRVIAERLHVHRGTFDNYLARWPTVLAAYNEEVENIGDLVESVIIADIASRNVETAKWYARMKLKNRGYVERQEVTGAEGKEILLRVIYGDDGTSNKQNQVSP